MKENNSMTMGQYIAACCLSVFSPISRLLPKAVLARADSSGWLAPIVTIPPLLGIVWLLKNMLCTKDAPQGLAQALEEKLGKAAGRVVTLLLCLWLILYAGFLLRSGGERLLSTVYPTGKLSFFLPVLLLLSLTLALGSVRAMGRCSSVALLLFIQALLLVFLMALPTVESAYVWPPDATQTGAVLLSALPVLDVLSPWVWFSFMRGSVQNERGMMKKNAVAVLLIVFLTMLFLLCTIGILGPELSRKLQYPFFIMVKNLRLFNVAERFDALVIVLWIMTDYVCIGMLLRSASEGLRTVFRGKKHTGFVLLCGGLVLLTAFLIAPNAFIFEKLSETYVPAVNLTLVFIGIPMLWLAGRWRSRARKA